jgi:hypothetical protein
MSAKSQSSNAATQAANTASTDGSTAATAASAVIPYESRQLTNPSGVSQQDIGAQLTAGLAGAGGATAGLAGAASKDAATTRNPNGFSAALDAAARSRQQAAASTSEGIAANNANVKLQQQQQAGNVLSGMYGTSLSAQNGASGQIAPDVQANIAANRQTFNDISSGISDVGDVKGMF